MLEGSGLQVFSIEDESAFDLRPTRPRDDAAQIEGMRRIARAFIEDSQAPILQALVDAAVGLCNADSAGISIIKEDATDESYYHWVATAGDYNDFLNAELPRYPSACGVCLERGLPQTFQVDQQFFDILGVQAPLVTDGLLLPWESEGVHGTIFIMAHGRTQAFDRNDLRMMQALADFAATGIRQTRQRQKLLAQEKANAAALMAHDLAHLINNPLQSLTNLLYLASEGHNPGDAQTLAHQMSGEFARLSTLVAQLLTVPAPKSDPSSIPAAPYRKTA